MVPRTMGPFSGGKPADCPSQRGQAGARRSAVSPPPELAAGPHAAHAPLPRRPGPAVGIAAGLNALSGLCPPPLASPRSRTSMGNVASSPPPPRPGTIYIPRQPLRGSHLSLAEEPPPVGRKPGRRALPSALSGPPSAGT